MKKFAIAMLPVAFAMAACDGPNEEMGEDMDDAAGTDGVITEGPMEERGEAMDEAMEERGEAMEERGEELGNEAMEERGEEMEDAADGM